MVCEIKTLRVLKAVCTHHSHYSHAETISKLPKFLLVLLVAKWFLLVGAWVDNMESVA